MYLRFTQRKNSDGSTVRYVALAHNYRVDGQSRPQVLLNLGRVDQLDLEGLRRLAASINKHFGDGEPLSEAVEVGRRYGADAGARLASGRAGVAAGCAVAAVGDRRRDRACR